MGRRPDGTAVKLKPVGKGVPTGKMQGMVSSKGGDRRETRFGKGTGKESSVPDRIVPDGKLPVNPRGAFPNGML